MTRRTQKMCWFTSLKARTPGSVTAYHANAGEARDRHVEQGRLQAAEQLLGTAVVALALRLVLDAHVPHAATKT